MVKEVETEGKKEDVCDACGYRYEEREVAERCEKWCTEHHSCNLEIVALGIPPEENA